VSNDGKIGIISKGNNFLVNHKSKDSHHGGTAVVQLNSSLEGLGFLIKAVPSEINVSVTEVTNELVSGSLNVTHDGNLQDTDEGNDLDQTGGGDGVGADDGSNTVGVRCEGVTRVVNGSWKVDSSAGDDLSQEGKHADTSVLDLDVSEAVESVLIGSVQQTKGIPKTKRGLDTKDFIEVRHGDRGGLGGLLGRSESGGLRHVRYIKRMMVRIIRYFSAISSARC